MFLFFFWSLKGNEKLQKYKLLRFSLYKTLHRSHLKNGGAALGLVRMDLPVQSFITLSSDILSFLQTSSDQEERTRSVEQFRQKEKDVLVATDVASKGLDFPDIQHVINYDMPEDIENYGEILHLIYLV